ncbi:unnamed protein product [Lepeophtheirus salmonis]|uniref:(salmon louse) hypothetical protein n=1 Tax=Lepeophtheirus salmonis TaxID=72036 RepID=A0A7R8D793_LEPSM|nr:unnamed protein product [Lepeophtheirus salmonis]CAF2997911.1 unnamed protein product [Lepeophtheirus salmonis]
MSNSSQVPAKKFRLRSVCAVSTCRSPQEMSFHRLPREPRLRDLWMKACGRKTPVTANARICGLHFRPQDFVRDLRSELLGCRHIRRLQPYAIPTINLPEGVQMEEQHANTIIPQYDISNIHNYAETTNIKTLELTSSDRLSFQSSPGNEIIQEEEEDFMDSSDSQLEETIIHITPETESSPLHVGVVNIPYDKKEITKILVLKSISEEAFNYLCNRGMIHNPLESHQNKWMKTFRTHQGVQIDTLDVIEERIRAYTESKDRLCILGIDEIPVRKGSEEVVTVGFARGLFKKLETTFFPPESLSSCISGFGFDSNTFSFPNPHHPDKTIFAFPDSCRILQLIRNEILTREITVYNKMINVKDFKKILKQCDHLTSEHLDEEEQRFSYAAQLLSWSSSKALANCGKKKQSYLVKVLNDWFDVMNSSENRPPLYGDRLSVQSKSLANLLKLLPKVSFVKNDLKPGPKSMKPTSIGLSLVISIQSTEALYTYIQTQYKARSFSTGKLSLEFIEDMIGPSFIHGSQHLSVFHRFRMLQFLGPDKDANIRDNDMIPTQQAFNAMDIKINLTPYLEKNGDSDEEYEVQQEEYIF